MLLLPVPAPLGTTEPRCACCVEPGVKGCYAQVTLRDEEHNFAVCDKPADHSDAHEDFLQGVTWTDEHHA